MSHSSGTALPRRAGGVGMYTLDSSGPIPCKQRRRWSGPAKITTERCSPWHCTGRQVDRAAWPLLPGSSSSRNAGRRRRDSDSGDLRCRTLRGGCAVRCTEQVAR